MDLSVNNMPSLSQTLYGITQDIETSQIRLSTGLRINSSKDDAAGVTQVSEVTSEVNENDVIISDLAKTKAANDYYGESISDLLTQMEDIMTLVNQAKDTNLTADERAAIEFDVTCRVNLFNSSLGGLTYKDQNLTTAGFAFEVKKNGNTLVSNDTETTANLQLAAADVSTATNAGTTYTALEAKLDTFKTEYLEAGTSSKVMEIESERLSKVNAILETTKSQIQDVDVVAETAELTKNQILNQSTTTVMAQANTMTSAALTLMNGLYS